MQAVRRKSTIKRHKLIFNGLPVLHGRLHLLDCVDVHVTFIYVREYTTSSNSRPSRLCHHSLRKRMKETSGMLTNSLYCIHWINQAYSEYKHVLANILRSLFVARTPSEEARSPGRRSNVENAPR